MNPPYPGYAQMEGVVASLAVDFGNGAITAAVEVPGNFLRFVTLGFIVPKECCQDWAPGTRVIITATPMKES